MRKVGLAISIALICAALGVLGEPMFNLAVGEDRTSGFVQLRVADPESIVNGVAFSAPMSVYVSNFSDEAKTFQWSLRAHRLLNEGEIQLDVGQTAEVKIPPVGRRFMNRWMTFMIEGLPQQLRWWIGDRK